MDFERFGEKADKRLGGNGLKYIVGTKIERKSGEDEANLILFLVLCLDVLEVSLLEFKLIAYDVGLWIVEVAGIFYCLYKPGSTFLRMSWIVFKCSLSNYVSLFLTFITVSKVLTVRNFCSLLFGCFAYTMISVIGSFFSITLDLSFRGFLACSYVSTLDSRIVSRIVFVTAFFYKL